MGDRETGREGGREGERREKGGRVHNVKGG